MLVNNRSTINTNNGYDHNEAFVERQAKVDKDYTSLRYYNATPIVSTVVAQPARQENVDPENIKDHNHNNYSYRAWVTKTRWL